MESQTWNRPANDALFAPVCLDDYFKASYMQYNGQSVEKMIIL